MKSAPDLAQFLQHLAEEGHAMISSEPLADDTAEGADVLQRMDAQARGEMALVLPDLSMPAALWAARLFYDLCRFVACRDIGEEQIIAACQVPCPQARGPETDWSADLVLRHLPKLFQLARHLSNADPLLQQMKQIAVTWPFSSAGIAGLENVTIDSFADHAAMRRIYADRIIAAGDASRLGHAVVDEMLRGDFGVHRNLAPAMAAKLFAQHDTH